MTKSPISLQDLRRSLYVKAKAEPPWRFWGLYVHVCKMETLREAYRMARSNGGARGTIAGRFLPYMTYRFSSERRFSSFIGNCVGLVVPTWEITYVFLLASLGSYPLMSNDEWPCRRINLMCRHNLPRLNNRAESPSRKATSSASSGSLAQRAAKY